MRGGAWRGEVKQRDSRQKVRWEKLQEVALLGSLGHLEGHDILKDQEEFCS